MTTLVVGGGLFGLVCARKMALGGEDVRVLERSARPGGVVKTDRRDGFLLELGPNTVRPTPEILGLVRALGLESEALVSDPLALRFLAWNGALHALPSSPLSLLATPLLSARGKLRLLAEPFVPRGEAEPEETVAAFFTRRLGAEVADRFVAPFVSGIFAGDPRRLSAESAFPPLVSGERRYGSLFGAAVRGRRDRPKAPIRGLLSFREGLETLPRALAAALGDRLEPGSDVESVVPAGSLWAVRAGGETRRAERLVLACPAREAARLVVEFAPEAAAALQGIPQGPIAVLHLAWPQAALGRSLRGFGHLGIRSPGERILGAVWSSSLFPGRAPEGQALITAFAGGTTDPKATALSDQELATIAASELTGLLEAREQPRLLAVTRWPEAIPQYDVGHAGRVAVLARTETRWPGLVFGGSYRGGVSVGDVVRNAIELAGPGPRPTPHL
ncbi:MAG: protoporphyrinogen oxidase [Acidobacteriota bacterium]|nr:protoporphyrinogen oxidase [Acidobacteriota bacterium]